MRYRFESKNFPQQKQHMQISKGHSTFPNKKKLLHYYSAIRNPSTQNTSFTNSLSKTLQALQGSIKENWETNSPKTPSFTNSCNKNLRKLQTITGNLCKGNNLTGKCRFALQNQAFRGREKKNTTARFQVKSLLLRRCRIADPTFFNQRQSSLQHIHGKLPAQQWLMQLQL